jgi:hypothetical protein
MDQSILPYCVIYDMDQSILNSIFYKSVATGIITVVTDITIVVMDMDNSYVAMGVDDIIMHVATILLFKCARSPKP